MEKKRQPQASIAHNSQGTFVIAFMMLNFCVDMKLSSISLMAMLTSFWLTDSRRWSLAWASAILIIDSMCLTVMGILPVAYGYQDNIHLLPVAYSYQDDIPTS